MSDQAVPTGSPTAAIKSNSKLPASSSMFQRLDSRELLLDDELFDSLPLDDMIRKSDPAQIDRLLSGHMKQFFWKTMQQAPAAAAAPTTPTTVASTPSRRERIRSRWESHGSLKKEMGATTTTTKQQPKGETTTTTKPKTTTVTFKEGREEPSPKPKKGILATARKQDEESRHPVSPPASFRNTNGGELSFMDGSPPSPIKSLGGHMVEPTPVKMTGSSCSKETMVANSNNSKKKDVDTVVALVEERFASRFDAIQKSIEQLPNNNKEELEEKEKAEELLSNSREVSPQKLETITAAMETHFAPRFDAIEGSLSSIQQTLSMLANTMVQMQQQQQSSPAATHSSSSDNRRSAVNNAKNDADEGALHSHTGYRAVGRKREEAADEAWQVTAEEKMVIPSSGLRQKEVVDEPGKVTVEEKVILPSRGSRQQKVVDELGAEGNVVIPGNLATNFSSVSSMSSVPFEPAQDTSDQNKRQDIPTGVKPTNKESTQVLQSNPSFDCPGTPSRPPATCAKQIPVGTTNDVTSVLRRYQKEVPARPSTIAKTLEKVRGRRQSSSMPTKTKMPTTAKAPTRDSPVQTKESNAKSKIISRAKMIMSKTVNNSSTKKRPAVVLSNVPAAIAATGDATDFRSEDEPKATIDHGVANNSKTGTIGQQTDDSIPLDTIQCDRSMRPALHSDLARDENAKSDTDSLSPMRPRRLQYRPARATLNVNNDGTLNTSTHLSWELGRDDVISKNDKTECPPSSQIIRNSAVSPAVDLPAAEQKDGLSRYSVPVCHETPYYDDLDEPPSLARHRPALVTGSPSSIRKTVSISASPPTYIPAENPVDSFRGIRRNPVVKLNALEAASPSSARKTVSLSPSPTTQIPAESPVGNFRANRRNPGIKLNAMEYPFQGTEAPESIPIVMEPGVQRRAPITIIDSPQNQSTTQNQTNSTRKLRAQRISGSTDNAPSKDADAKGASMSKDCMLTQRKKSQDKDVRNELNHQPSKQTQVKSKKTITAPAANHTNDSQSIKLSPRMKDIPTSIRLDGEIQVSGIDKYSLPVSTTPATLSKPGQQVDETCQKSPLHDNPSPHKHDLLASTSAIGSQGEHNPIELEANVPATQEKELDLVSQDHTDSQTLSSDHPSDEEKDELMSVDSSCHSDMQFDSKDPLVVVPVSNESEGELECSSTEPTDYYPVALTSPASSKSHLTDERPLSDELPELEANPTDETPVSLANVIKSLAQEEAKLLSLSMTRRLQMNDIDDEGSVSDISGAFPTVQSLPEYMAPFQLLEDFGSYTFPIPGSRTDENMLEYMHRIPSSDDNGSESAVAEKKASSNSSTDYASPPNSILANSHEGEKGLLTFPLPSTSETQQASEDRGGCKPKGDCQDRKNSPKPKNDTATEPTPHMEHPLEIRFVQDEHVSSPSDVSTVSYSVASLFHTRNEKGVRALVPQEIAASASHSQDDQCCSPSNTFKLLQAGNDIFQGASKQAIIHASGLKPGAKSNRGSIVWSNPGHKADVVVRKPDEKLLLPALDTFPKNNPAFAIIAQKIAEAEAALKAELARDSVAKYGKRRSHFAFDQIGSDDMEIEENEDDDEEEEDNVDNDEASNEMDLKHNMEIFIPTGPRLKQNTFTPMNVIRPTSPGPSTTILTDSGDRYVELVHMGSAALFDYPASPAESSSERCSNSSDSSSLYESRAVSATAHHSPEVLSSATRTTKSSFLERFQAKTENKDDGQLLLSPRRTTTANRNYKTPPTPAYQDVDVDSARYSCHSDSISSQPDSSVGIDLMMEELQHDENTEQDAAQILEIVERYYHYYNRYNAGNPKHFVVPLEERKKQPLDQLLSWTMVAFEEIEKDFLTSFHDKAMEDLGSLDAALFGEKRHEVGREGEQKRTSDTKNAKEAEEDKENDGDGETNKGRLQTIDPLERVGIFNFGVLGSHSSNTSGSSSIEEEEDTDDSSVFSDVEGDYDSRGS